MRWLVFAAAAVALSGCALPPIVTVASFALDFASYGSTGKTVTDHGLSLVLQEDCALLRVLEDGTVCSGEPYEFAAGRPTPEPESQGERRIAFLEEEANRMLHAGEAEVDSGTALQFAYAADPAIVPQARTTSQLSQAQFRIDGRVAIASAKSIGEIDG